MNLTTLLRETSEWLTPTSPNYIRNKEERIRILVAFAFAHVGIFAKYFMPEYVETNFGKHHDAIFTAIPRHAKGQRVNILAPRGSAKSTCMAIIYPLHCIYFKWAYEKVDIDPIKYIIILSKSFPIAKQRICDIKHKIETDPQFQHLLGKTTWSTKSLITSNNIRLAPLSRGGQIRGSLFGPNRPDLIISDDLDDPETVLNPDVRQKDHLWFDSDLIRAGRLDGKTNFVNIDTVKHEESIANKLRTRPGWKTLFFQAIQNPADLWHPTAEPLWKQWEKIYSDMSLPDAEREANAEAFYQQHKQEMHGSEIEELWPEMITYLDVRKEICNVGYFPVLREFQNSCRDPSKAIFDMDNAIHFEITKDGLLRSDDRLVRWRQIAGGSVFLDWAGGKDTQDNAFAAAVCVLWEPMPGRRENPSTLSGCHAYVLSVWMDKVKLSMQIDNAITLLEEAQATMAQTYDLKWRLAVEDFVRDTTGAIGEYVRATYREAKERRQTSITLEFMPRYTNKIERIAALEPAITHGWLAFNKKLPSEYIKQMSQFPTADHMDGPDATEGACQLRVTEFPSVHKAKRERNHQLARNLDFRL